MEKEGLQIASAIIERMGLDNEFLKAVLMAIFQSMHFYRNSTKSKQIPTQISKEVHIFFATFMVTHSNKELIAACDSIQQGILFMILKSEGDKVNLCKAPQRDKKYVIATYSNLVFEHLESLGDTAPKIISALIDLAHQKKTFFENASNVSVSVDDMLEDSAIDKTFAYQRLTHVQLQSARTAQADQLEKGVPNVEVFLMNKLVQLTQAT